MPSSTKSRQQMVPGITAAAVLVLVLALALAACGTGPSTNEPAGTTSTISVGPAVSSSATTPTAGGQNTSMVRVYFPHNERLGAALRVVSKSESVEEAALRALLEGPTAEEKAAGMSTAIPESTVLLGLSIKDGLATVDLSKEFASEADSRSVRARHAQLVFTLTQFAGVKQVEFREEGRPMGDVEGRTSTTTRPTSRASFQDVSPGILVDSPATGDTVGSPIRVTGSALGGTQVVISIAIYALDDGSVIATWENTFWNTGSQVAFDLTLGYASRFAGQAAKLVVTAATAQADGQVLQYVESVPISLK